MTGAVLAWAGSASAAVYLDAKPCAEEVHLKVEDAPLSEVLSRMSRDLGFHLDTQVQLTELVTIDRTGAPARLLKRLLKDRNLVVHTQANPSCGGRESIASVWVLPAGAAVPAMMQGQTTAVNAEAKGKCLDQQHKPSRNGPRHPSGNPDEQTADLARRGKHGAKMQDTKRADC